MQTAIVKANNRVTKRWLSVIKEFQDRKFKVLMEYPKQADVNVVLSGKFENPMGGKGKRVLVLDKKEWFHWEQLYGPIVKHYYDAIIDITDLAYKPAVDEIIRYVHAQERQAHKS